MSTMLTKIFWAKYRGVNHLNRKSEKITLAAIAVSAVIGSIIGFYAGREQTPQKQVIEPVSGITAQLPQKKPRYLLSQYEGKLAVYIIGKTDPELVFDRYLHYLPDVDRMKLEQGIEVADYSELLRLIEDYTS